MHICPGLGGAPSVEPSREEGDLQGQVTVSGRWGPLLLGVGEAEKVARGRSREFDRLARRRFGSPDLGDDEAGR